jgi:hypothetical protein
MNIVVANADRLRLSDTVDVLEGVELMNEKEDDCK